MLDPWPLIKRAKLTVPILVFHLAIRSIYPLIVVRLEPMEKSLTRVPYMLHYTTKGAYYSLTPYTVHNYRVLQIESKIAEPNIDHN